MTRGRRGSSRLRALLVGLGLPAIGLFGLFSLIPYERMTADWPLGIRQDEVYFYQHWFDQRPDTMASVDVERFELDADRPCHEGDAPRMRWFTGRSIEDSVVAQVLGEELLLVFPEGRPFEHQHAMRLSPASMGAIRSLYAKAIARKWLVACGEGSLVRLTSCGKDRGLFLAEEVSTPETAAMIGTPDFLLTDSTWLAAEDSSVAIEVRRSFRALTEQASWRSIDEDVAVRIGLIAAAGELSLDRDVAVWFDPDDLAFKPALVTSAAADINVTGIGTHALKHYLSSSRAHNGIQLLAEGLRKDSALIAAHLAAVDDRNASAFVGETRIGYVRAQLAHERKAFLQRLLHPDPVASFGLKESEPLKEEAAVTLDPWLRKYLQGDTIRFPRGKHGIDHLVTVPKGKGVVMEKGARFTMAPGAGLIINGEWHVRGTGLNPVFIRPQDEDSSFAGICVNGDGGTRCVINGLKMSGGSEVRTAEQHHRGMLGYADCEVRIRNSTIEETAGPAVIACVRGRMVMDDCVLRSRSGALLDLSFTRTSVRRCSFISGEALPGRAASAGVKATSSRLFLSGCGFSGIGGDAIVLATGSEAIVASSGFKYYAIGLLIKDGASAFADGNTFTANGKALVVQGGRKGRAGARVFVHQNTFLENGKDQEVDPGNTVVESPDIPSELKDLSID